MGIGDTWFGRRRRFVSGGAGGTLYSIGGYGGNYVLGIDGEWTRLAETFYDDVSSDAHFAPVLQGKYLSVILGNYLLNWLKIFANAVKSFSKM